MIIKFPCVQCCALGVSFTAFDSVSSMIDCVASLLKVGAGLEKSKKMTASVEVMFHERFCGLCIPHTYRFFFDMDYDKVVDYLAIELKGATFSNEIKGANNE